MNKLNVCQRTIFSQLVNQYTNKSVSSQQPNIRFFLTHPLVTRPCVAEGKMYRNEMHVLFKRAFCFCVITCWFLGCSDRLLQTLGYRLNTECLKLFVLSYH